MDFTTNKGVRIHYESIGSGPPLVLQHGFSQSRQDWRIDGYVDALAADFRLILIDARGHGESDKPHDPAAYRQADFVGDIVAVLDALGIERSHYWGYSMGGWIGLGMAEHAKPRLLRLVIGGQHAFGRKAPTGTPSGDDTLVFLTAVFARLGLDFSKLSPGDKSRWLANDTRALAAMQQDRSAQHAMLPALTIPCLFYAGDADGVFENARKTAALVPGSTFVPLAGLDHFTAFASMRAFVPHVVRFLR